MSTPAEPILPTLPAIEGFLSIFEDEPSTSPYTGRNLRRVQLRALVRGDDNRDVLDAAVSAASSSDGPWLADSGDGQWSVENYDYSYRSSGAATSYEYNVAVIEREQLNLTGVEFAGLRLNPYRWRLDISGERAQLLLLADMELEDHQAFETVWNAADPENPFMPVTWLGVSDRPLSMRLGRCLWQKLEGSRVRHLVRLISEQGDEPTGPGVFDDLLQPEFSRVMENSLRTAQRLDALIDELHQAGALSDDAVERISAAGTDIRASAIRDLDRARDVETFFD